jgi:hypothetical protein
VWGEVAWLDELANFFKHEIYGVGLVDVGPIKLSPTLMNNITSEARVSKRLNIFSVLKTL